MRPMLLVVIVKVPLKDSVHTMLFLVELVLRWRCLLSCADCRLMEAVGEGTCRGRLFASRDRVLVQVVGLEEGCIRTEKEEGLEGEHTFLAVGEMEEDLVGENRSLSVAFW